MAKHSLIFDKFEITGTGLVEQYIKDSIDKSNRDFNLVYSKITMIHIKKETSGFLFLKKEDDCILLATKSNVKIRIFRKSCGEKFDTYIEKIKDFADRNSVTFKNDLS